MFLFQTHADGKMQGPILSDENLYDLNSLIYMSVGRGFIQRLSLGGSISIGEDGQVHGSAQGAESLSLDSGSALKFLDLLEKPQKYFTAQSLALLDQMLNDHETMDSSSFLDKYGQMDLGLKFISGDSFFRLYSDLDSRYLFSEEQKVSLMAFWTGNMQKHYDQKKSDRLFAGFQSPTPEEMVMDISKNGMICGDINGTFLKRFSHSLGLSHSSLHISASDSGSGHVVGLIKGREGYYHIDYSKASYLGKNPDMALESLMHHYGGFTPLSTIDESTRFFSPPSQRLLFETIEFANVKVGQDLGVSVISKSDGSLGIRYSENITDFTYGAFYLRTPHSLKNAFGTYLNYRSGEKEGSLWLPELDLSFYTGGSKPFTALVQAIPYQLSLFPTKNLQIRLNPLRLKGTASTPTHGALLPETNLGFIYHIDRFSEIYSSVDLGYCVPEKEFYEFHRPQIAKRFNVGYNAEDSTLRASYTPDSMIERYSIDMKKRFSFTENLSLAVFAQVSFDDGASIVRKGFGGILNYNF